MQEAQEEERRRAQEARKGERRSGSTIKAQNMIIKEQIWFNWMASEIVFQPLHPESGALLHNERAIAVPEEPILHLELYWRDVTGDMRLLWNVLVHVILKEVAGDIRGCDST